MSYINQALGTEHKVEYPNDVWRIQNVAMSHGITLTTEQAEAVWRSYSDDMAAGWMSLPESDEELWEIIE